MPGKHRAAVRSPRRWLITAMVVGLVAALVGPVGADDHNDFTLYAGQDIPVGEIIVTNDTDTIFVEYSLTGDWCMTESHLEVATDLADIPQNNGNPPPGQFTYSAEHDCVYSYTYEVPFDGAVDDEYLIAAHAEVWDTSSVETVKFWSDGVEDGGTTMVTETNTPNTVPFPAVDAWEAFNDPPDTEDSTWDTRVKTSSMPHDFEHGDWIWEDDRVVDPTVTQYVTFEHEFEVPGYPVGGMVYIANDNTYTADLNGSFLGEQTVFGNWDHVGSYSFMPLMGTNTLEVMASNFGNSSYTLQNNPAGLIFEGYAEYYDTEESAWSAGNDFPGKNWATYSTYTIEKVLVETVTVDSSEPEGATSSALPEASYVFEATGTWFNAGVNRPVDAEWVDRNNDGNWSDGPADGIEDRLDLQFNGAFIDWGPYDSDHEYTYDPGSPLAGPFTFRVWDDNPTDDPPPDGNYSDNQGSLTVNIYWVGS